MSDANKYEEYEMVKNLKNKLAILAIGVCVLSGIIIPAVCNNAAAQAFDIFRDQTWNKYYNVAVTDVGGTLELSCMFHTTKNCQIYGQLFRTGNDFTAANFTNHFYLYDKDGIVLIKDLGNASAEKTDYADIAGNSVYTMKINIDISPGIGNETGMKYAGAFLITAHDTSMPTGDGTSGGSIDVALTLEVNATIIKDMAAPVITSVYPADGSTITMYAPTLRARYHDISPGTGVKNVTLKLGAQTVTPDKWNSTELYYNIRAPLSPGTHTFTVNVTDYAGHSMESISTFNATRIADTTAPVIANFTPAVNEIVGYASPTFTVEWSDNGSGINIGGLVFALDGSQYTVPLSDITDKGFTYTVATQLVNGPHWWSVKISDYATPALSDYKLINFTVLGPDILAPSSQLSIMGVSEWSVILCWTASDNLGGSGLANVTIYYAVNSYRDQYGAYAWNRWRIFSNDTTHAMFNAAEFNIQTGDKIYFRSAAVDLNGNDEGQSKWDPDTNIIFEAPKPQPTKADYTVVIVVGMLACAAIGWAFLFLWIKREEIRFTFLRREIKKKAEEMEKEKEKEEEQE